MSIELAKSVHGLERRGGPSIEVNRIGRFCCWVKFENQQGSKACRHRGAA